MEETLNDLQAVDNYIEKCRQFVSPALLRNITSRGLYDIINYLPSDVKEAKSVARARLAKIGRSFGDEEIDQIANTVKRIEHLRDFLNKTSMTDVNKTLDILNEMVIHSEFVKNYFK